MTGPKRPTSGQPPQVRAQIEQYEPRHVQPSPFQQSGDMPTHHADADTYPPASGYTDGAFSTRAPLIEPRPIKPLAALRERILGSLRAKKMHGDVEVAGPQPREYSFQELKKEISLVRVQLKALLDVLPVLLPVLKIILDQLDLLEKAIDEDEESKKALESSLLRQTYLQRGSLPEEDNKKYSLAFNLLQPELATFFSNILRELIKKIAPTRDAVNILIRELEDTNGVPRNYTSFALKRLKPEERSVLLKAAYIYRDGPSRDRVLLYKETQAVIVPMLKLFLAFGNMDGLESKLYIPELRANDIVSAKRKIADLKLFRSRLIGLQGESHFLVAWDAKFALLERKFQEDKPFKESDSEELFDLEVEFSRLVFSVILAGLEHLLPHDPELKEYRRSKQVSLKPVASSIVSNLLMDDFIATDMLFDAKPIEPFNPNLHKYRRVLFEILHNPDAITTDITTRILRSIPEEKKAGLKKLLFACFYREAGSVVNAELAANAYQDLVHFIKLSNFVSIYGSAAGKLRIDSGQRHLILGHVISEDTTHPSAVKTPDSITEPVAIDEKNYIDPEIAELNQAIGSVNSIVSPLVSWLASVDIEEGNALRPEVEPSEPSEPYYSPSYKESHIFELNVLAGQVAGVLVKREVYDGCEYVKERRQINLIFRSILSEVLSTTEAVDETIDRYWELVEKQASPRLLVEESGKRETRASRLSEAEELEKRRIETLFAQSSDSHSISWRKKYFEALREILIFQKEAISEVEDLSAMDQGKRRLKLLVERKKTEYDRMNKELGKYEQLFELLAIGVESGITPSETIQALVASGVLNVNSIIEFASSMGLQLSNDIILSSVSSEWLDQFAQVVAYKKTEVIENGIDMVVLTGVIWDSELDRRFSDRIDAYKKEHGKDSKVPLDVKEEWRRELLDKAYPLREGRILLRRAEEYWAQKRPEDMPSMLSFPERFASVKSLHDYFEASKALASIGSNEYAGIGSVSKTMRMLWYLGDPDNDQDSGFIRWYTQSRSGEFPRIIGKGPLSWVPAVSMHYEHGLESFGLRDPSLPYTDWTEVSGRFYPMTSDITQHALFSEAVCDDLEFNPLKEYPTTIEGVRALNSNIEQNLQASLALYDLDAFMLNMSITTLGISGAMVGIALSQAMTVALVSAELNTGLFAIAANSKIFAASLSVFNFLAGGVLGFTLGSTLVTLPISGYPTLKEFAENYLRSAIIFAGLRVIGGVMHRAWGVNAGAVNAGGIEGVLYEGSAEAYVQALDAGVGPAYRSIQASIGASWNVPLAALGITDFLAVSAFLAQGDIMITGAGEAVGILEKADCVPCNESFLDRFISIAMHLFIIRMGLSMMSGESQTLNEAIEREKVRSLVSLLAETSDGTADLQKRVGVLTEMMTKMNAIDSRAETLNSIAQAFSINALQAEVIMNALIEVLLTPGGANMFKSVLAREAGLQPSALDGLGFSASTGTNAGPSILGLRARPMLGSNASNVAEVSPQRPVAEVVVPAQVSAGSGVANSADVAAAFPSMFSRARRAVSNSKPVSGVGNALNRTFGLFEFTGPEVRLAAEKPVVQGGPGASPSGGSPIMTRTLGRVLDWVGTKAHNWNQKRQASWDALDARTEAYDMKSFQVKFNDQGLGFSSRARNVFADLASFANPKRRFVEVERWLSYDLAGLVGQNPRSLYQVSDKVTLASSTIDGMRIGISKDAARDLASTLDRFSLAELLEVRSRLVEQGRLSRSASSAIAALSFMMKGVPYNEETGFISFEGLSPEKVGSLSERAIAFNKVHGSIVDIEQTPRGLFLRPGIDGGILAENLLRPSVNQHGSAQAVNVHERQSSRSVRVHSLRGDLIVESSVEGVRVSHLPIEISALTGVEATDVEVVRPLGGQIAHSAAEFVRPLLGVFYTEEFFRTAIDHHYGVAAVASDNPIAESVEHEVSLEPARMIARVSGEQIATLELSDAEHRDLIRSMPEAELQYQLAISEGYSEAVAEAAQERFIDRMVSDQSEQGMAEPRSLRPSYTIADTSELGPDQYVYDAEADDWVLPETYRHTGVQRMYESAKAELSAEQRSVLDGVQQDVVLIGLAEMADRLYERAGIEGEDIVLELGVGKGSGRVYAYSESNPDVFETLIIKPTQFAEEIDDMSCRVMERAGTGSDDVLVEFVKDNGNQRILVSSISDPQVFEEYDVADGYNLDQVVDVSLGKTLYESNYAGSILVRESDLAEIAESRVARLQGMYEVASLRLTPEQRSVLAGVPAEVVAEGLVAIAERLESKGMDEADQMVVELSVSKGSGRILVSAAENSDLFEELIIKPTRFSSQIERASRAVMGLTGLSEDDVRVEFVKADEGRRIIISSIANPEIFQTVDVDHILEKGPDLTRAEEFALGNHYEAMVERAAPEAREAMQLFSEYDVNMAIGRALRNLMQMGVTDIQDVSMRFIPDGNVLQIVLFSESDNSKVAIVNVAANAQEGLSTQHVVPRIVAEVPEDFNNSAPYRWLQSQVRDIINDFNEQSLAIGLGNFFEALDQHGLPVKPNVLQARHDGENIHLIYDSSFQKGATGVNYVIVTIPNSDSNIIVKTGRGEVPSALSQRELVNHEKAQSLYDRMETAANEADSTEDRALLLRYEKVDVDRAYGRLLDLAHETGMDLTQVSIGSQETQVGTEQNLMLFVTEGDEGRIIAIDVSRRGDANSLLGTEQMLSYGGLSTGETRAEGVYELADDLMADLAGQDFTLAGEYRPQDIEIGLELLGAEARAQGVIADDGVEVAESDGFLVLAVEAKRPAENVNRVEVQIPTSEHAELGLEVRSMEQTDLIGEAIVAEQAPADTQAEAPVPAREADAQHAPVPLSPSVEAPVADPRRIARHAVNINWGGINQGAYDTYDTNEAALYLTKFASRVTGKEGVIVDVAEELGTGQGLVFSVELGVDGRRAKVFVPSNAGKSEGAGIRIGDSAITEMRYVEHYVETGALNVAHLENIVREDLEIALREVLYKLAKVRNGLGQIPEIVFSVEGDTLFFIVRDSETGQMIRPASGSLGRMSVAQ